MNENSENIDMAIELDQYLQLERYLLGEMDEEAGVRFREQLQGSLELQRDAEFLGLLIGEIVSLPPTEESRDESPLLKKGRLRLFILLASLAAAISILAIWGFLSSPSDPAMEVFSEYFHPDPRADLSLGSTDADKIYLQASKDYRKEKYTEAISGFKSYLELTGSEENAIYFLGISFLATSQTDSALARLDELRLNNMNTYQKDIVWYIGLAKVQAGDFEEARIIFNQIKEDPFSIYAKKAKEILDDLEGLI